MATQAFPSRSYWNDLQNRLLEKIDFLRKNEHQPLRVAQRAIQFAQEVLAELQTSIQETPFSGVEEQIVFYKETQPFFLSRIIFFSRLLNFEAERPLRDPVSLETHLQKEWQSIRSFQAENAFLFRYIRVGETSLDGSLFVQSANNAISLPDLFIQDRFIYNASTTVAYFHALEFMQDYLLASEEELRQPQGLAQRNIPRLTWTDSKAALIELAYAIQSAGSLNDRKADLREIIECLQAVFHIDLGHYPRVFQEILSRKSGYTNYIDRLREKLLLRIKIIEDKYDRK